MIDIDTIVPMVITIGIPMMIITSGLLFYEVFRSKPDVEEDDWMEQIEWIDPPPIRKRRRRVNWSKEGF